MLSKDYECETWRKINGFYTQDTIKRLNKEEKLSEKARYREVLYDWVMGGRIGSKPLYKNGVIYVIKKRDGNFITCPIK